MKDFFDQLDSFFWGAVLVFAVLYAMTLGLYIFSSLLAFIARIF